MLRKGRKVPSINKDTIRKNPTDLPEQFHVQVFECHRAIHQLLLLQQQHEQTALHVSQQVARAVRVDPVVTDDGALLCARVQHKQINKKR